MQKFFFLAIEKHRVGELQLTRPKKAEVVITMMMTMGGDENGAGGGEEFTREITEGLVLLDRLGRWWKGEVEGEGGIEGLIISFLQFVSSVCVVGE